MVEGPVPVLAVEGLGVSLSGRALLRDVGFTVGAGPLVGRIGSNGAGKTTLIRVLLGLLPAGDGDVRIDGRPRSARRPLIGYVPQKITLDPDTPLRARDLVALGLDGGKLGFGWPSKEKARLVAQALDAVEAGGFADSRVGTLSGGEQQRVLIAHALISRPRLLLLDEPLANLDIRSADGVARLLSRIAREQQIGVLISAHEMNALLPVMDRVVYLAGGRAASGTTEQVVRTEVLSELYGHRIDVLRVHGRVLIVAGPDDEDRDEPDDRAAAELASRR